MFNEVIKRYNKDGISQLFSEKNNSVRERQLIDSLKENNVNCLYHTLLTGKGDLLSYIETRVFSYSWPQIHISRVLNNV